MMALVNFGTRQTEALTLKARDGNPELTLKEAIAIGLKQARVWNKDAALYSVTSVDEKEGGTRGETGRRFNWNMDFMVPGKEGLLGVFISEGKVVLVHEGHGNDPDDPIKTTDLVYDSPALVQKAKDTYHLQKSLDWATGYQFTLFRLNGKTVATVLGMDQDYLWTSVNLDPKTGEIISALHKVPHGGGLTTERLGSYSPHLSKKGMAVMGIASNHNNIVIWGDKKPRVFNFAVNPFIEISHDRGQTWTHIDFNKRVIHAWFDSHDHLYATTELGVWRYEAPRNKMTRLLTLNSKVDKFKIDISTNTIAFLLNNIIYTSIDNGKHWSQTNQPKPSRTLQISNKGEVLLLTNEGDILIKNGSKWSKMQVPAYVGNPVNMKLIDDTLFVLTYQTLWVYPLKSNFWNKVQIDAYRSGLVKKGNRLYLLSENNNAYHITFVKNTNKWKAVKVFQGKEGLISDLDISSNYLFVTTVPDYYWEDF